MFIPFSILSKNGSFYGVSTNLPPILVYNVTFIFTITKQVIDVWLGKREEERRYSSSASMTDLELQDDKHASATIDIAGDEKKKQEKKMKEEQQQQKSGLYDLLHSKKGFKAFKEYLALEFAVENILFWDAVNKFHKCSDGKLPAEAQRIKSTFIGENSTHQVNIDIHTVRVINEKFANNDIDRTIFDVAQTYIFELMKTDSYRRFVRSKYNVFKKEKKDAE